MENSNAIRSLFRADRLDVLEVGLFFESALRDAFVWIRSETFNFFEAKKVQYFRNTYFRTFVDIDGH